MSLNIRSNIASINAQRQLALQNAARDLTVQRTSSGNRINSAKDDAAGLAASVRLTSKVQGYSQAARNVNEAISFALTADAGLQSVNGNLQRIRQLTVQAGNSTISKSDREALVGEINDLIQEISGVTKASKFNNKTLLDGSLGQLNFQVGASARESISVSLASAAPGDIGQRSLDSNRTQGDVTLSTAIAGSANNTFAGNGFAAQQLTINGINGDTVTSAALNFAQGATAKQVAAGINSVTDKTGVTAVATTTATLSNFTNLGLVKFKLFGKNTGGVPITANVSNTQDLSSLAAVINSKSGQTGVTAVADRRGSLVLTEADGNDIGIKSQDGVGEGINSVLFRGADVVLPDGSTVAGPALSIGDASGANTVQTGGQVSLRASEDYAVTTSVAGTLFKTATSSSKFSSLANIDLTTVAGTAEAIKTIDAALVSVNKSISKVGSLQVRLDKMVSQLNDQTGAAQSARSRISDTDYANETSRLTRAAILQNAATTVMSQANAQARNVLTLLRF